MNLMRHLRLRRYQMVLQPGQDAAKYRFALRQAEAASGLVSPETPNYWTYLRTLGMALYRAGKWEKALDTLTAAYTARPRDFPMPTLYFGARTVGLMGSPLGQGPFLTASAAIKGRDAPILAFLAMAHHRLGNQDEARTLLGFLRVTMSLPQWARNEEAQAFLREAEALIEGQAPDLKK
jgi:hypothetical protein